MLALLRLGDEAYGVPISREIEDASGKVMALAHRRTRAVVRSDISRDGQGSSREVAELAECAILENRASK